MWVEIKIALDEDQMKQIDRKDLIDEIKIGLIGVMYRINTRHEIDYEIEVIEHE